MYIVREKIETDEKLKGVITNLFSEENAYVILSVKDVCRVLGEAETVTRVFCSGGKLFDFVCAVKEELEGYEESDNAFILLTANKNITISEIDRAVLSIADTLSTECNIGFALYFDEIIGDGDIRVEIILSTSKKEYKRHVE